VQNPWKKMSRQMNAPLPRGQIHPKKNLSRMIKKKEKKIVKVTLITMMSTRRTIFLSETKMRRRRSWIRSLLGKEVSLWRREV
jgi:hypothetical protein